MKTKPTLSVLRGAIATLLASIVLAATAQAQNVRPPAGLKWQWMNKVWFNTTVFKSTGTPREKTLLAKIWEKEISGSDKDTDGSLFPSSALIGTVEQNGLSVILSMYNRANSDCIQPGNGRGMIDMYATCPLRIVRISANGQSSEQNLSTNFCMLDEDDSDTPRAKNHTEYAFDARSGIVYLRTIQYGKVVQDCNRAIRIFKV